MPPVCPVTGLSSMALSPDGTLLASGAGRKARSGCGTRPQEHELPLLKDIGPGSVPCRFLLTAPSWPPGHWIKRSSCGTWEDRELIASLEGHTGPVTSVSFSPDGALLASAGGWNDATVWLWDVGTREPIGTLEGHTNEVRSVSFSPDGALLASAGGYDDKTVKLWNVATRELIASLEDHTGSVNSVVFSPDGKTLASGSSDRTVRLWDAATRTPISSLDNRSSVYSLAFSSDGAMLVQGHGAFRSSCGTWRHENR